MSDCDLTVMDIEKKFNETTDLKNFLCSYRNNPGYGYSSWRPIDYSPDVVAAFIQMLKDRYPYSGIDQYLEYSCSRPNRRYYGGWDNCTISTIAYFKLYEQYPCIEQLVKAGIVEIIDSILRQRSQPPQNYQDLLKRNFKKGKTLKDITGLPAYVLSSDAIRNIGSLTEWNEFRVIVNKHAATKETFDALTSVGQIEAGNWGTVIRKMKRILNSGYYTLASLLAYLDRVDTYQAIRIDDAIDLLTDYVSMCIQCNTVPVIDTNSLKREHDVMMRNFWLVKQDIDNEKFDSIAPRFQKYEYEEDNYVILAPKSASDIINEGVRQRNCVGSYIKRVTSGHEMIMFMRKKSAPDKSFVTISMNPRTLDIGQKLLSCNHPINDPRINGFIDRWQTKIRQTSGIKAAN